MRSNESVLADGGHPSSSMHTLQDDLQTAGGVGHKQTLNRYCGTCCSLVPAWHAGTAVCACLPVPRHDNPNDGPATAWLACSIPCRVFGWASTNLRVAVRCAHASFLCEGRCTLLISEYLQGS